MTAPSKCPLCGEMDKVVVMRWPVPFCDELCIFTVKCKDCHRLRQWSPPLFYRFSYLSVVRRWNRYCIRELHRIERKRRREERKEERRKERESKRMKR